MQKINCPESRQSLIWASLALTFCLVCFSNAKGFAGTPLNSINYDQIIKGGTYENTAKGKTVFYNANGLWLQNGTTIHGIEVNNQRQQTGNGGAMLLQAPNSVVRLDGDINVNGFTVPGNTGHGGNVTIDAAYLYQSGNIFARGGSGGGVVNINVNSATFAPTAGIDASAPCGAGGVITIKATGVTDLQRHGDLQVSHMNTSGANPAVNINLIDIQSGLVHNYGLLRADGVSGAAGGTIRLTASGAINLQPVADALYHTHVFTPDEAKARFEDVRIPAASVAPNGRNYIENSGEISADGGNNLSSQGVGGKGGSIQINSPSFINGSNVSFTGITHANGGAGYARGGDGGNIVAHTGTFANIYGIVNANGGNGTTKLGAFGGNGGLIHVNTQSFHNGTNALMSANGGNGTAQQGNGGKGGVLCLRAAPLNPLINSNFGRLDALGGNGSGGSLSIGGAGGMIDQINITNFSNGTSDTSAGHP